WQTRMDCADGLNLGCDSDLLFLASGERRELGARMGISRATPDPRNFLPYRLSCDHPLRCLLRHSLATAILDRSSPGHAVGRLLSDLFQCMAGRFEQRFRTNRAPGSVDHPEIGSDVAHLCHA